jgi:hypothetical protein
MAVTNLSGKFWLIVGHVAFMKQHIGPLDLFRAACARFAIGIRDIGQRPLRPVDAKTETQRVSPGARPSRGVAAVLSRQERNPREDGCCAALARVRRSSRIALRALSTTSSVTVSGCWAVLGWAATWANASDQGCVAPTQDHA